MSWLSGVCARTGAALECEDVVVVSPSGTARCARAGRIARMEIDGSGKQEGTATSPALVGAESRAILKEQNPALHAKRVGCTERIAVGPRARAKHDIPRQGGRQDTRNLRSRCALDAVQQRTGAGITGRNESGTALAS